MPPLDLSPGMIAQVACLLEATARKPGNVHRLVDFEDTTYLDFALSAGAIVEPLDRASAQALGSTILQAVEATHRVVATNTNLGMILLLVPLASVPPGEPLQPGVASILERSTVADARDLYRGIRLAKPGGLGRSEQGQDVSDEPTVTLLEAMRLASDRDLVARQYATGFLDVFDRFVPVLADSLARPGWTLETAIVAAFLDFLAERPDTLIARKLGGAVAREASDRAADVLKAGWPDGPRSSWALAEFDAWLRADGHARNPGASADLASAGLFVALRTGIIGWPIATRWSANPAGSSRPPGF